MKEKIIDILTKGNSNQIKSIINTVFNRDSDLFMSFLDDIGVLSDENIYPYLIEEMPMSYLSTKFKTNPDKTTKFIVDNYFGDIISQNGRYILKLASREDLSAFFKNDGGNRDVGSQELAKLILQEDWWEPFYDSLQDVYDEIIENLTPENLKLLAERINDELSSEKIEPETSLLEDIAEDQGHPEYVELSVDLLLNTIFEDKESTKHILDEASDINMELYSLYHDAFNTAYIDEKWDNLANELKSLLSIDNIGEYKSRKVTNYTGEKVNIENYYIDVTNFLPEVIKSTFDDEYMNDDYRNVFDNYGGFESFVTEMIAENVIEGGSLSIPYYDYPDYDRVEKYINEMFGDYI